MDKLSLIIDGKISPPKNPVVPAKSSAEELFEWFMLLGFFIM